MTPRLLASLNLGPIEFLSPMWLLLIPILVGLSLWISRRSLSGLGRSTRVAALIIRAVVICLLTGAFLTFWFVPSAARRARTSPSTP